MEGKYPISELVRILGITRTAVENKIKKYSFNTVKEYVDGRPKTLVILSNEQLEALKIEVQKNKTVNTMESHTNETKLNNVNTMENQSKTIDVFESYKTELRYYVDRLLEEKEKNMLLLSDKLLTKEQDAEFWKNKYFELEQENKQLKKKSSFFGMFKK